MSVKIILDDSKRRKKKYYKCKKDFQPVYDLLNQQPRLISKTEDEEEINFWRCCLLVKIKVKQPKFFFLPFVDDERTKKL